MLSMWLLCAGGQKIANVATFGKLGGKSEKSDSGGKEAYKVPKVGLLYDNVFVLTLCIAKLALQHKSCSAAQKLICMKRIRSVVKFVLVKTQGHLPFAGGIGPYISL